MMGEKHRRNDWKPDSGTPLVGGKAGQGGRSRRGRKGPNDPELLSSPHAISIELPYD